MTSSGLILLHTKAKRWLQPGGHADGNARLEAVALREAQEESGIENLEVWSRPIDIDVHVVEDPSASQSSHLHLDVRYLIKAPKGREFKATMNLSPSNGSQKTS